MTAKHPPEPCLECNGQLASALMNECQPDLIAHRLVHALSTIQKNEAAIKAARFALTELLMISERGAETKGDFDGIHNARRALAMLSPKGGA